MTSSTEAAINYPVLDADSHVVEPSAVWDTYLEPEYRVAARSAFWHEDGEIGPATILNGKLAEELYTTWEVHQATLPLGPKSPRKRSGAPAAIPRHGVWRPGMSLQDVGALSPNERHEINPGASQPLARLADMDRMGVDQSLIFPTYFAEYFPLVENPDLAQALARAYNAWVQEFCNVAPDRLFPVAVLPTQEVGAAVKEARRVAKLGFKGAMIRPVFLDGRFPHHPYYYPLWRELEELGLVWCSHSSPGINAGEMDAAAPFVERVLGNNGVGYPQAEVVAGVMDQGALLTGMMADGLLEKFPGIRFYFVHSKASWLHLFLEKAEGYLWLSTQEDPVSLAPDKVFETRETLITLGRDESAVWATPDLFEDLGAWGSFYPNHDTYPPSDCVQGLRTHGVSEQTIANLMGGNAARVFGIDLKARQPAT